MKNITILLSLFLLLNFVGCNKTEENNEVANSQLIKVAQTDDLELAKQAIANSADINAKKIYINDKCMHYPTHKKPRLFRRGFFYKSKAKSF